MEFAWQDLKVLSRNATVNRIGREMIAVLELASQALVKTTERASLKLTR